MTNMESLYGSGKLTEIMQSVKPSWLAANTEF